MIFWEKFNIISEHLYGFQSGNSTSSAVLEFILRGKQLFWPKWNCIGFISWFLSTFFDTLDLFILLDKLSNYGIRGVPLDWCKNYLFDRNQFVFVNNFAFQLKTDKAECPKALVGPLLFLTYMNDIYNMSNYLKCIHFADDTSIFMSIKDPQVLKNVI